MARNQRGQGRRGQGGNTGGDNENVAGSRRDGDGVLGNGDLVYLSEYHRRAFGEIFETPVEDPMAEYQEGALNIPRIRQIYTFDIPAAAFEANATSFASISRTTREFECYRDLLLMISMCLTNPSIGTPTNVDLAGDDAQNGGGAAAPAAPAAGGAGHGQRQGRAQEPAIATQDTDLRGEVTNEGANLFFSLGGQKIPRVSTYVEEVMDTQDKLLFYRWWLFVLDPRFNLGEAFESLLRQNQTLYGPEARNDIRRDTYVSHSAIHSTPHFVERVISPYLRRSIHPAMTKPVTEHYNEIIRTNLNLGNLTRLNVPLQSAAHVAHPNNIFNKINTFAFCSHLVCEDQRDPAKYFNMQPVQVGNGAQGVRDMLAAEDRGVEDLLNDAERNELAALEDPIEGLFAATRNRREQYLVDPMRESSGTNSGDEGRNRANIPASNGPPHVVDRAHLDAIRAVPDSAFVMFPRGERVTHIPVAFLGRRILRIPLPSVMRREAVVDNGITDDQVKAVLGDDISNSVIRTYANLSRHDSAETAESMSVADRRAELEDVMNRTEGHAGMPITMEMVDTAEHFLSAVKRLRLLQAQAIDLQRQTEARRQILDWIHAAVETSYEVSDTTGLTRAYVYGGLLPENVDGRISSSDYRHFMQDHIFLKLRLANAIENQRIITRHQNDNDNEVALRTAMDRFFRRATREGWDALMESEQLPQNVRKMVGFYRRQALSERWGDHAEIFANLTSYGNFKVKVLSRYNHTFRGGFNQHVFLLTWDVYMACFLYGWGLRLNFMQTGKHSVGKSHVFECMESMALPGSFETLAARTNRANTGQNDSTSDRVLCMHEAPLEIVGVDKYGREVVADPLEKDGLTRSRVIVDRYTTNRDGISITQRYSVMRMENRLIATNEVVPPETAPMMSRYMIYAVNERKLPGYNAANNNNALSDTKHLDMDRVQVHHSQLFAWYVFVVCKNLMMKNITDVSMDAAEILVKEISDRFTALTGISTSQTRKRKMVMDMICTETIQNAVHSVLFSPSSLAHSHENDPATGKNTWRDFDPMLIVDEIMPRLYATTEIVAFVMSQAAFMWEYEHRFTILRVFACGHSLTKQNRFNRYTAPVFRRIVNPDFNGIPASNRTFNPGQKQTDPQNILARTTSRTETENNEDGDVDTRSPILEDPRYISLVKGSLVEVYQYVVAKIVENSPSENEVQRTLRDLSQLYHQAHPVTLEFDDDQVATDEPSRADPLTFPADSEQSEIDDPAIRNLTNNIKRASGVINNAKKNQTSGYARTQALKSKTARLKWVLHKDQPTTSERVVIIEKFPVQSGGGMGMKDFWQVSVLAEYIEDEAFEHAMLRAIKDVLSNDTQPREGRDYLVCQPYAHVDTTTGKVEVLPQFLTRLHVDYNPKRKMRTLFDQTGTSDAEMCSLSMMRSQHHNAPRTYNERVVRDINFKFGIEFDADVGIDEYAAMRHWQRCYKDPNDFGWLATLPSEITRKNAKIMRAMARSEANNVVLIQTYPEEAVKDYLVRRKLQENKDKMDSGSFIGGKQVTPVLKDGSTTVREELITHRKNEKTTMPNIRVVGNKDAQSSTAYMIKEKTALLSRFIEDQSNSEASVTLELSRGKPSKRLPEPVEDPMETDMPSPPSHEPLFKTSAERDAEREKEWSLRDTPSARLMAALQDSRAKDTRDRLNAKLKMKKPEKPVQRDEPPPGAPPKKRISLGAFLGETVESKKRKDRDEEHAEIRVKERPSKQGRFDTTTNNNNAASLVTPMVSFDK